MSGLNRSDLRLLGLWGILLLITIISFESGYLSIWVRHGRLQGGAVIILAFVKARLIILDFMDVRHAAPALRLALETWIAVLCAALIGLLFYRP